VKLEVTCLSLVFPRVPFSFTDFLREEKDAAMTMTPATTPTTAADKMKSVKSAWDKAPAGPKKDAALTHYQAAEKSHAASDEAGTHKSLDAATKALV
jgi:hypothetical protein